MQLRKRASVIAASILTSSITVAGLSIGPASAQAMKPAAASSSSSCGASTFCMYSEPGYAGTQWSYPYSGYRHNAWIWVGGGANDKAESVYANREYSTAIAQNNPGSDGAFTCFGGPGGYEDLFGYYWPVTGASAANSISSFILSTTKISGCPQFKT
jgi:hypothetical protein